MSEVIKLPVHFEHGFVIDDEKEIVCNLLWTTHRKNWDRRDEAGEHIALCINEHQTLIDRVAELETEKETILAEITCANVEILQLERDNAILKQGINRLVEDER